MRTTIAAFRPSLGAILLGAALFPITAPRTLNAQEGDSVQVCYVPLSGTMYRVNAPKAPASCTRPEHVAFSLSAGGAGAAKKGPGSGSGSGATDHGALAGLTDDDHPQYLLADGVRSTTHGFAVAGTLGQGAIPATGAGARLLWYPGKAAFRVGRVTGTHWDDLNVGQLSFASGDDAWAAANASVAFGRQSYAGGEGAFAGGQYSRANGTSSFAVGQSARAIGDYSVALGASPEATGYSAVALGINSQASGSQAISFGTDASATAHNSVAIGLGATASGQASTAIGVGASTNGKVGAIAMSAGGSVGTLNAAADHQLAVRAQHIWFGWSANAVANAGRFIETTTGAYLTTGGAWTNSSDSTKKHRWKDVDGESVLTTLAALPIRTWSYRDEADSVRHVGPTAQAFRAAFGLGDTDKAIATVDADGVALAAAQALERRTRELYDEIAALRAELAAVRAELRAERAAVNR